MFRLDCSRVQSIRSRDLRDRSQDSQISGAALYTTTSVQTGAAQHSTGGRELILGLQFLDLCLKSPLLSLSLSFSLCFLSGVSAF